MLVCFCIHSLRRKNVKCFPSHMDLYGSPDLRFCGPQPDISLHGETTDMGLVHHVICLITSQLSAVYHIMLPGDRGRWV